MLTNSRNSRVLSPTPLPIVFIPETRYCSVKPLTVSEVAYHIRDIIQKDEILTRVSVEGEITDYRGYTKHLWFTIKDEGANLKCVMWENRISGLKGLELENGMKVVVHGDITTYPKASHYQLNVSDIKPKGAGDLYKKFLELKRKLLMAGLFDELGKKPIPKFVRSVGIVSSNKSAGFRDMISVFESGPPIDILTYDARVQGVDAAQEIKQGIEHLDGMVDLIIFGRGGGSMEDLWCFNDEELAHAVFNCKTPIISAVGHEVDQVITDMVADDFAVTPTAAAKLVVNNLMDVIQEMKELADRLGKAMDRIMNNARQTLDLCDIGVMGRAIKTRVEMERETTLRLSERAEHCAGNRLMTARGELTESRGELKGTWIAGVKEKGLAAISQNGRTIHDSASLIEGEFEAIFRDGKVKGEVKEVEIREGS